MISSEWFTNFLFFLSRAPHPNTQLHISGSKVRLCSFFHFSASNRFLYRGTQLLLLLDYDAVQSIDCMAYLGCSLLGLAAGYDTNSEQFTLRTLLLLLFTTTTWGARDR